MYMYIPGNYNPYINIIGARFCRLTSETATCINACPRCATSPKGTIENEENNRDGNIPIIHMQGKQ